MAAVPPIRNARLLHDGVIDCEVKGADGLWHPYGAIRDEPGLPGAIFNAALPVAVDARKPAEPFLTRAQWDYMLAVGKLLAPIRAVLDAIYEAAETPEERVAFAELYHKVWHSESYRLSEILALVAANSAAIKSALGSVPTEAQITEAFNLAKGK